MKLSEWARAVRERDGKCLRCGSTSALVAHHIKPKSVFPELRLEMSNGETLCSNCHTEHHKREPGKQDVQRRVVRRTERYRLRLENAALKKELSELKKRLVEADRDSRVTAAVAGRLRDQVYRLEGQVSALRAELVEYEVAYDKLNSWEAA